MKKITNIILKLIVTLILLIISLFGVGFLYFKTNNIAIFSENQKKEIRKPNHIVLNTVETQECFSEIEKDNIDDWKLILVSAENPLPDDFSIELTKVSGTKEFDSRAANELLLMLQAMKNAGASNIWIQSAYRTPEYQENLYKNKVQDFIKMGKNEQDAELLASKWVNKSETSEHNLGLAVDFNNVKRDFENTKEFAWLVENAEDYGFILRYKKEKRDITKVNYEPWHWRYVGVEHAKEINKLDMCLEEYIEYIKEKDKIVNDTNF